MSRYNVMYKDKILSGPHTMEDAEMKLLHLSSIFQNLEIKQAEEEIPSEPNSLLEEAMRMRSS